MNFRFIFMISLLNLGLTSSVWAANITNNINMSLTGIVPKNAGKPYFCISNDAGQITPVAPGQTVDGNKASKNAYYVGGTLRLGGCEEANTYLGYAGFSINEQHNHKFSSYGGPAGITYANPAVDVNGNISGKIQYGAINPNFEFLTSAPKQNNHWQFVGVNLAGFEFGKLASAYAAPNLSKEGADNGDLDEMRSLIQAGMNTVRVPVSWGYLQVDGPGKGDLNVEYFNAYIKPLLETLTSAQVHTIVDLHAYMRYSELGKEYSGCGEDGKCPDGTLITDAKAYQDVWTKLYALIKNDPKINMNYILLDLMNEPVEVPDNFVFTIQAEVIKSLRAQGFQGYILVEGNSWSGLHSWTTDEWTSRDGKTKYTNATLFSRENFVKAGISDLNKIIINAHQYLDDNYSGTKNTCVTDLNTTGVKGFNLDAFVDYLKQNHLKAIVTEFGGTNKDTVNCTAAMKSFLNYLQDNAAKDKDYGFIGWTLWSAGHGWGTAYPLRVTPTSFHMTVLKNYLN